MNIRDQVKQSKGRRETAVRRSASRLQKASVGAASTRPTKGTAQSLARFLGEGFSSIAKAAGPRITQFAHRKPLHGAAPYTNLYLTADELLVDNFAGGGGASTGIEAALARSIDVAVNHDADAIAMHSTNHPRAKHYQEDVFVVDPVEASGGRPVGLAWFSPDCKHFSRAKGGKPVNKKIRSLAWVAVKWADKVRPRVICVENVPEFKTWGPLRADGTPCKKRAGQTFRRWVSRLTNLGYVVEHRELRACDFGAPTIRTRLFVVARCDGQPIVWPTPTHGDPESPAVKAGRLLPWRTAAECIDWSLDCPSIFERKKALKDATCRRIAQGIMRFIVNSPKPFVVPMTSGGGSGGHKSYVAPTLVDAAHGEVSPSGVRRWGKGYKSIELPLSTVTASGGNTALVSAFLAKHYKGVVGTKLSVPIGTVTSIDHHSLVTASIVKMRGTNIGHPADTPLHTVSAGGTHHAEVRAFLRRFAVEDGHAVRSTDVIDHSPILVWVEGEAYEIVDIGFRMLTPDELFRAQGFPIDYVTSMTGDGKRLSKKAQIRLCGNSVCPPVAEAIVRANFQPMSAMKLAA